MNEEFRRASWRALRAWMVGGGRLDDGTVRAGRYAGSSKIAAAFLMRGY